MPFNYDFNKVSNVKTVNINPNGWINPITIEFGIGRPHIYDNFPSIIWRVKGTTHCFTIYEPRINFISKGNYEEHFKEVLEKFKDDYLSWKSEQYKNCSWVDEYRKQYSRFIIE